MRTKNQSGASRHIIQVFYEYCATAFEVIHHIGVVNDFMAHIHRRTKFQKCTVHDFNRSVYSGTKPTGFSQYDFLKGMHTCSTKFQ